MRKLVYIILMLLMFCPAAEAGKSFGWNLGDMASQDSNEPRKSFTRTGLYADIFGAADDTEGAFWVSPATFTNRVTMTGGVAVTWLNADGGTWDGGTIGATTPVESGVFDALTVDGATIDNSGTTDNLHIISSAKTITVASSGGDFTTIADAFEYAHDCIFIDDGTLTISIGEGVWTQTEKLTLTPTHPTKVFLEGVDYPAGDENYFYTDSIDSITGSSGDWDVVVNVNAANSPFDYLSAGDWILIYGGVGGTAEYALHGVHEITNVNSGASQITFTSTFRGASHPAAGNTVLVFKELATVLERAGDILSLPAGIGGIDAIMFARTTSGAGVGLDIHIASDITVSFCGFSGFNTAYPDAGVNSGGNGLITFSTCGFSNCVNGLFTFGKANIFSSGLSGNTEAGIYVSNSGVVFLYGATNFGTYSTGNAIGVQTGRRSSAIISSFGYVLYNSTYGLNMRFSSSAQLVSGSGVANNTTSNFNIPVNRISADGCFITDDRSSPTSACTVLTADKTVTSDEAYNSIYSNTGASALVTVTLPAAVAGMELSFIVLDTDGIRIQPNGSEQILNVTDTAGDYYQSTTLYSSLTIRCYTDGYWNVIAEDGTWAEES